MSEPKIELGPRHYKSGDKARGDRTILVDGVAWGHVVMKGHGCHAPTYEFYDAAGRGIHFRDGAKVSLHQLEKVRAKQKKSWRDVDDRPTEQRIIDKARELIADGRMRSPLAIAAEVELRRRQYQDEVAAADAKRLQMRVALASLSKRTDLTAAERAGLNDAYVEIFEANLETDQ